MLVLYAFTEWPHTLVGMRSCNWGCYLRFPADSSDSTCYFLITDRRANKNPAENSVFYLWCTNLILCNLVCPFRCQLATFVQVHVNIKMVENVYIWPGVSFTAESLQFWTRGHKETGNGDAAGDFRLALIRTRPSCRHGKLQTLAVNLCQEFHGFILIG